MRQETTSFYYTLCEYTPGPEGGSQRLLKSSLRDATTDLQTESRKISRHFALSLLLYLLKIQLNLHNWTKNGLFWMNISL